MSERAVATASAAVTEAAEVEQMMMKVTAAAVAAAMMMAMDIKTGFGEGSEGWMISASSVIKDDL